MINITEQQQRIISQETNNWNVTVTVKDCTASVTTSLLWHYHIWTYLTPTQSSCHTENWQDEETPASALLLLLLLQVTYLPVERSLLWQQCLCPPAAAAVGLAVSCVSQSIVLAVCLASALWLLESVTVSAGSANHITHYLSHFN